MAWKSEEMAAIVHEFVNVHPRKEVRRALFRADEIDRKKQYKPRENRPREKLPKRDRSRTDFGSQSRIGHVDSPRIQRPTDRNGMITSGSDFRHSSKRN